MRTQKNKRVPGIKISEADVQQAVVLMLALDGWRAIRTDPVSDRSRGKGFGEIGMPDYLFIRYGLDVRTLTPDRCRDELRRHAEVMFVEFKAKGQSVKPHQYDWHQRERLRGALVIVCDEVGLFREWYKTSGLMRNTILS